MPEEEKEEKLDNKSEEGEDKAAEYLAGWQRAKADFINYKKDELKRMEGFLQFAAEGFILKILPILDNFEIAFSQETSLKDEEQIDKTIEGFRQIEKQLKDFLQDQGVEEIKSMGEKFDPNLHEAVERIESDEGESETIIEEVQKGYKINGRLLRPAKVKVLK